MIPEDFFSLSIRQDKSQEGEDKRIEDPDDGQDVCPSDVALSDIVFIRVRTAKPGDFFVVPACWEDDATQEHADTWKQLNPTAKEVDSGSPNKEEEQHANDAQENENCRDPNEECRSFEGVRQDGAESVDLALTLQDLPGVEEFAVFIETEISRSGTVLCVSNPLGLDDNHDVDDGET